MYGHSSPQPIVTTTSACSASARSRARGLRSARSMPSSAIASTTAGWTRSAGRVPADAALCRPPAARSKSAWLIWERPALWRQTKTTCATALGREDQLLGELARQTRGGDLDSHGLGVVRDPLDRHLQLAPIAAQDRERGPRVAVLRLADRPAVHEQHSPMLAHPRLVRVAEDQHGRLLGRSEALVEAVRLLLEEVLVHLPRRAVHEVDRPLPHLEAQVEGQLAHEVLRGASRVGERPVDRALAEL